MKKGLKITLTVLCALILAVAAGIFVFYLRVNDPSNVFPDMTPATTPAAGATSGLPVSPGTPGASPTSPLTPEPTPTPIPESVLADMSDAEFMKGRVNILVLGIDKSVEREASGSFRTDTMILVSVNFKTLDVDMISIPRDSYVKLYNKKGELIDPADPFNKINAAFSLGGGLSRGGYASAMSTTGALLGGIPVNYYVSFDMNAVKRIVDAMGGIEYEVDIEVTMNGRTLSPGLQHLDGQAVIDYCRQRKGSSDTARADRQQRILMAIFHQMKSTGQIANLPKLYQSVQDSIVTDLSFEQICSLSLIALRMDGSQLQRHMVPGKFASVYARDCWLVDLEKLSSLLEQVYGTKLTLDPEVDGAAVLAFVESNHLAVEVKLYNAALIYNELQSFTGAYKAQLSQTTLNALSKNRSLLATAIRRENGVNLSTYTALLNEQLEAAYASLGIARTPPAFLNEDGTLTLSDGSMITPDTSGVLGTLEGVDEEGEEGAANGESSGGLG